MLKKIAVIGPGGSGKTSLIHQFLKNKFEKEYNPTIQDHYYTRTKIDETVYLLHIVDTAGHLQMIQSGCQDQWNACLLVYDISNLKSFVEVTDFYYWIIQNNKSKITLCGNKTDLQRQVSYKEGLELAVYLGCQFIEISAKDPSTVEKMWMDLVHENLKPKKAEKNMCKIL